MFRGELPLALPLQPQAREKTKRHRNMGRHDAINLREIMSTLSSYRIGAI
jgi:hypothetical protein